MTAVGGADSVRQFVPAHQKLDHEDGRALLYHLKSCYLTRFWILSRGVVFIIVCCVSLAEKFNCHAWLLSHINLLFACTHISVLQFRSRARCVFCTCVLFLAFSIIVRLYRAKKRWTIENKCILCGILSPVNYNFRKQ